MREILHYGVKERSGRYKWGTGDRPYQRLEMGLAGGNKTLSGGRSTLSAVEKTRKSLKTSKTDLSEMSDKELRDKINRLNMERQFKDLTYERSKGLEYMNNFLEVTGGLVTMAGGIATIATSIYLIRKG